MRISIDDDLCSGHGRCYTLAPDLFEPDEQGRSIVLVDVLSADQIEAARMAVLNCPEQAITLVDD